MDRKELSRKTAIVSMLASQKKAKIAYLKGMTSEELSKLIEQNPTEALLTLKDSIVVGDKKIEGFMVCPLCGNHKKLQKAPKDGVGYKFRLIKRRWAEEYCKMEENEQIAKELAEEQPKPDEFAVQGTAESSKHCQPPFAIRYEQEHLKKNLIKKGKDIVSMASELINETANGVLELVKSINKSPEMLEQLEKRLYDFFISVEHFEENGQIIEAPILRQPFFENGENIGKQKILSIRINFGNPYAGKTKKFLLYIRALLRLKNITETILRNKLTTVIIPELIEKMTRPEIEQLEELLSEKLTELETGAAFAPTQKGVEVENISVTTEGTIESEEETESELNNEIDTEDNFPPFETGLGDFQEYGRLTKQQLQRIEQALRQMSLEEIKEKLVQIAGISPQEAEEIINKTGVVIDKLFPKFTQILELKEGFISGFVELDEITLEEAIAIIKLIKGSSFEKIMMIIKATRNAVGLKLTNEELEKETIDFLIFIGYLYAQVKRIETFAKNLADFISSHKV